MHDVRAAVDELPADLRSVIKLGEVETVESFACPTCAGTKFRLTGGCPKCAPIPVRCGR